MKRISLIFIAMILSLATVLAQAAPIPETKRWHEPYVTLLDVDFGDTGFHARWEYFQCGCGDILVRVEQSAPDGVVTGEILLVDGQVIASRGMVSLSRDLEPMLQAPSIMMHLAFTLLEKAVPEGPATIQRKKRLKIDEGVRNLDLNSGMATGSFKAPWKLRGETWKSEEGQRRFELDFEFSNPTPDDADNTDSFRFTGGQDYRRDGFPLTGAMPLEGWKVQWISKGESVASEAAEGATLQDLRDEAFALSNPET